MNEFYLNKETKKEIISTSYGLVAINNIIFDPLIIENYLPNIVFDDDNLKYMFQQDNLDNTLKRGVLTRFIPNIGKDNLEDYIKKSMTGNVNFYSFLAEGMMALIFRDIKHYELAAGAIDVRDTLNDTHSGVDACMFDKDNNVIILGEAKFYKDMRGGVRKIISDFTDNNITNKIDSLKRISDINTNTRFITIKNIGTNEPTTLTLEEFLKQKIIFGGFVLHNSLRNPQNYLNGNYYDNFELSLGALEENIKKCLDVDVTDCQYEIFIFHLPIDNKLTLIEKMIDRAKNERNLIKEVTTNG